MLFSVSKDHYGRFNGMIVKLITKQPSIEAVEISESDKQRSDFIFKLVQQQTKQISSRGNKTCIPKTIVQFWDNKDDLPIDVMHCIHTWKARELEGFQHFLFYEESALDFILTHLGFKYADAFKACYHPAMKSDYFRLCYMYVKGGIYVDVDDIDCKKDITPLFFDPRLKLQPLCYDIDSDAMVKPELFT